MIRAVTITFVSLLHLGQIYAQAQRRSAATERNTSTGSTNDIVQLVGRLNKLDLAKKEFETREQHQARIAAASPRGPIVLRLDAPGYMNFDADLKQMKFELIGDEARLCLDVPPGTSRTNTPIICQAGESEHTLKKVFRKAGAYTGTNAFGATQRVDYSEYDAYGIHLAGTSPIQVNQILRSADFIFPMGIEEAKATKPFLAIELIGEVDNPMVQSGTTGHKPTLAEPYEERIHVSYVPFRLEKVRIVDKRRGNALATFTPDMGLRPGMVFRITAQ